MTDLVNLSMSDLEFKNLQFSGEKLLTRNAFKEYAKDGFVYTVSHALVYGLSTGGTQRPKLNNRQVDMWL